MQLLRIILRPRVQNDISGCDQAGRCEVAQRGASPCLSPADLMASVLVPSSLPAPVTFFDTKMAPKVSARQTVGRRG